MNRLPDRSSVEDWLILLKQLESLLRHPELGIVPMFPSASFWDLKTQGLKWKKDVIHVDAHIFCDILVSRSHGLTKGILYGKQTQGDRSVSEEIPVKHFTAEPDGESFTCEHACTLTQSFTVSFTVAVYKLNTNVLHSASVWAWIHFIYRSIWYALHA